MEELQEELRLVRTSNIEMQKQLIHLSRYRRTYLMSEKSRILKKKAPNRSRQEVITLAAAMELDGGRLV